jgi:DNA-binding SARP family transcriptional activator/tetratricopeptide (TPR) repeat protein
MRFEVLGPLRVRADDGPEVDIRPGKVHRVLCALLSHAGESVPVATLVDTLWPQAPPPSAVKTVQTNVSRLRSDLGQPDRITTQPAGYTIASAPDELDAHEFAHLVRSGQDARRRGELGQAAEHLMRALRLWRGQPYTGLEDCPALLPEIERLVELRIQALEELAEVRLERGEGSALVPELTSLHAENPYRERPAAQLMLALYRSGRQSDALEVYRRAYARLSDELGIEPGAELRHLHGAILRSDPALDPSTEPAAAAVPAPVPAQLPPDLGSLTGRRAEVDHLLAAITPGEGPGVAAVSAIDGMAGIGKTVLAVHVAHRVAESFPDGQLFLDLRGHTPGMSPLEPAVALDRLLRSVGVPGDQVPSGVEDRAALWRTRLAGKRVLVLLDNAADEEQVVPLLPGSRGCVALITSRRRLSGLDHARPVPLDVLPARAAAELFREIVGPGRLGAADEDAALLDELIDRCGRLPLAIRLLATRMRDRPHWRLADVVDRLRAGHHRLTEFAAGPRSVAAAFELSYQQLDPGRQRLFRLLGLHPGSDFDAYAAAALAGTDRRQAGQLLESLVDAQLLQSRTYERYTFHDLLRIHAAETAASEEPDAERDAALARLVDYYLFAASRAMDAYLPSQRDARPDVPDPGLEVPEPGTADQALEWLDKEYVNLVAVAGRAADGWPAHATQFADCLTFYFYARGYLAESLELHGHALRAYRSVGDVAGEARALSGLARIFRSSSAHADALAHLEQALDCCRRCGDQAYEAVVLAGLGDVLRDLGDLVQARDRCQQAVELLHAAGDVSGRRLRWPTWATPAGCSAGSTRLAPTCASRWT